VKKHFLLEVFDGHSGRDWACNGEQKPTGQAPLVEGALDSQKSYKKPGQFYL
tara:strand:- start:42345 stop:42500 length:156 start_codon:yes stop_codon:yes gene_type:complete